MAKLCSDARIATAIVAACAVVGLNAASAQSSDHNVPTPHAHVHGAWEMFAALDDDALTITLSGPVADLAGAESPPGSADETAAIAALRARVSALAPLMTPSAKARCRLSDPVMVRIAGAPAESHKGSPTAAGAAADHEMAEADHDDDDHIQVHGEGDEHGRDVEVVYAFACTAPDRLREITVEAFQTFEEIDTIDAVYLSETRQAADRLTRKAATLTLR